MDDLLTRLSARLPELEWMLNRLGRAFYSGLLPRGLFPEKITLTPRDCMDDIRTDLKRLSQQTEAGRIRYLADRVHQKINVLVHVCQRHTHSPVSTKSSHTLDLTTLSTRQQWLKTLEEELAALQAQQQALKNTLLTLQGQAEATLRAQTALGELERRLTLAQEAFDRATRRWV